MYILLCCQGKEIQTLLHNYFKNNDIFMPQSIDDFRNRESHAPHCWAAVVVQQYYYIIALQLPTSKQPTMVGVAFSIFEVYVKKKKGCQRNKK
jgi:hypothetical protein